MALFCKPEFFGTLARRKETPTIGHIFRFSECQRAIGGKFMFVRKSTFEHLVKRCESQQQQIEKLNEMVGILAQSLGSELEFNVKKDWNLSRYPNNEQHMNALDWSF